MSAMFEVAINEFPFVAEMPRAEKREAKGMWERYKELSSLAQVHGMLMPPWMASKLLDVSQQRVSELMADGRLQRIEWEGRPFVTENSVVDYAKTERKAGRPVGRLLESKESATVASAKFAIGVGRELLKNRRK